MVLALVLMLTACSSSGKRERTETEVIDQYSALVRWSQYDALVDYMHPDWLEENPVTSLDLERLKQFRVTGYRVRQIVSVDEGNGVERVVQLRMYHFHTARERQIDYLESWRWDEEYERWMLHSGLPDVTQGR
ncbi:MAG: hypothetical protein AAGH65_08405 [Pseudomonadota bacterium]